MVIIENTEKKLFYNFLIDLWKFGLVDYFKYKGSINDLKNKLGNPDLVLENQTQLNVKNLLKRGLVISDFVNYSIKDDIRKWIKKLKIEEIEFSGSIFKCFNCEEGELTHHQVESIKQIVKDELKSNSIGTPNEKQYYFVCTKCRSSIKKFQ